MSDNEARKLGATDDSKAMVRAIEPLQPAQAALEARYGIDSEYVGVPLLARVLGMGATTIYEHMRKGSFFIPHRMMNKTPRVALDDLAEWMRCADANRPRPVREPYGWTPRPLDPAIQADVKATLESMGIDPRLAGAPRAPRKARRRHAR